MTQIGLHKFRFVLPDGGKLKQSGKRGQGYF